jgi:hypothetical protein
MRLSILDMKTGLFALLLATGLLAATVSVRADDYPIKTCVVSGDSFDGDMGPPVDVTYKGRKVRLCCKSCVKKFNANPEKYISLLDAEIAKQPK